MSKEKLINILKGKVGIGIITGAICFIIGGSFGVSKYLIYKGLVLEAENKLKELKINYGTLEENNKQIQEKLNEAKPWFEMKEIERIAEEERLKEKKELPSSSHGESRSESQLDKEKEYEEEIGYDTGITYEQLIKAPNYYLGKKIKFSGTVLQVSENNLEVQVRLAINDDYKNNMLCGIPKSLMENKKIKEYDNITVKGVSLGLVNHKLTSESNIAIPGIMVDEVQ